MGVKANLAKCFVRINIKIIIVDKNFKLKWYVMVLNKYLLKCSSVNENSSKALTRSVGRGF